MSKIRKCYTCTNCGRFIEYGDDKAIECRGDIYCDEDCLISRLRIDCVDWSRREEFEEDDQTRENFYGAHIVKDRIITNGKYIIFGADTSGFDINDGYYKDINDLYTRTFSMRAELKDTKAVNVKLSECEVIDNTDGHIKDQQPRVFIEILGCKLDKSYVDLCVELLGLTDELYACNNSPYDPVLIETDDERFALIMSVLWDD
jgi:hypothetical protein